MFSVENVPPVNVQVKILKMQHQLYFRGWVFLGVVETIVGWPVCGGVGIVSFQSFVLRHLVIAAVRKTKKLPI